MPTRTAALAAVLAPAVRWLGRLTLRFIRDEPASATERTAFLHLNGLLNIVTNHFIKRTIIPSSLKAVD